MPVHDEVENRKGQSTLEYILVVAAVILAALVFLGRSGVFQNALNAMHDSNINAMVDTAERILR